MDVIPIENFQRGGRFYKRPGRVLQVPAVPTVPPDPTFVLRTVALQLAQESYDRGVQNTLSGLEEGVKHIQDAGTIPENQILFALTVIAAARLAAGGNAA